MKLVTESPTEKTLMPLANIHPAPRPFQQYVSDVPTGAKAVVKPATIKLTRQAKRRFLRGNAIPAAYIMKPKEKEAVFWIYGLYSVIRDIAFNFQRQHDGESFFEAYPNLLLLKDSEKDSVTTRELRNNYRQYASRLAHYYYYYTVFRDKLTAAIINLLTLSRFTGTDREKDIATLARWSLVNRSTNHQDVYLAPTGSTQCLLDNARFAVGSNANGASIIAMPLYDVSVYGNLGNHAGSLKSFISEINQHPNSDEAANTSSPFIPGNTGTVDEVYATQFLKNMAETVNNYYELKSFDILNSSALRFKSTSGDVITTISLTADGKLYDVSIPASSSTSLTNVAWNNVNCMFDLMRNQFYEMADPDNDKYTFALDQLKICEKPMTTQAMYNVVSSNDFYDITSLRNCMRFSTHGKPNTATIVRSCLPIGVNTTRIAGNFMSPFTTKDLFYLQFADNFDRFPVYKGDAETWLRAAKMYPGITPRVFPHAAEGGDDIDSSYMPTVLNCISSDGPIFPNGEGFIKAGKYASLYDIANLSGYDPENSKIEFAGLSTEDALAMVSDKSGFICYEDPSQPYVHESPVIDTTDPFQCGFYLLCPQTGTDIKSELGDIYTDPESYDGTITSREVVTTAESTVALTGANLSVVPFNKFGSGYVNSLPQFEMAPRYSLIFVGDGLFLPPQAYGILDSFAAPRETTRKVSTSGGSNFSNCKAAKALLDYMATAQRVEDIAVTWGGTYIENDDADGNVSKNAAALWSTESVSMAMLTVMRFAVCVGSPNTVKYEINSKKVINPAWALNNILYRCIAEDNGLELHMFNPMYGPVAIVSEPIPYSAGFGTCPDPSIGQDDAAVLKGTSMTPKLGILGGTKDGNYDHKSLLTTKNAAHMWSWFLMSISINMPYYDEDADRFTVKEGSPFVLDDRIGVKWPMALFDQVTVSNAAFGDTYHFQDYASTKGDESNKINASTVTSYPEQLIAMTPKRTNSVPYRGNKDFSGKDRSTSSFSTSVTKNVFTEVNVEGDRAKQRPSRGKKPRRFSGPKSARESTASSKQYASNCNSEPIGVKPKDDSLFDDSSKAVDKDVAKRRKGNVASLNQVM